MTRDVARMARTCKVVKHMVESLYKDYEIFDISPYEDNKNIQMTEEAFFNVFPARWIEKDETYLDDWYDRYFAEADGLRFFCLKEKEERE